jgi:hypothetical protein
MQRQIGYSLVDSIGNEIEHWYIIPSAIIIDETTVSVGHTVGSTLANGYKIVERWIDESPTTAFDQATDQAVGYDGTKVIVRQNYMTPSLDSVRNIVKSNVAKKRYDHESVGVNFANNVFSTSEAAQGKLASIVHDVLLSGNTSAYTVNVKTTNGQFVAMTGDDVINFSKTVRTYVQSCFDKEAYYCQTIDAASEISQLANLDITRDWPYGPEQ